MSTDFLEEMSKQQALYFSNRQGKKVLVNPEIQKEINVIQQLPVITGGDIPKFATNPGGQEPESYLDTTIICKKPILPINFP